MDIYRRFSGCSSSLATLPISGLAGGGGVVGYHCTQFFQDTNIPKNCKIVCYQIPKTAFRQRYNWTVY